MENSIIGIQILAIIFALWMAYFTHLHFKRQELHRIEHIFWQALWIGLIGVVIFPKSINFALETLRINSTFDFVLVVGVTILFAIVFHNYITLKRLEKKFEELIRSDSLCQLGRTKKI